jgi:hypothetical protein
MHYSWKELEKSADQLKPQGVGFSKFKPDLKMKIYSGGVKAKPGPLGEDSH